MDTHRERIRRKTSILFLNMVLFIIYSSSGQPVTGCILLFILPDSVTNVRQMLQTYIRNIFFQTVTAKSRMAAWNLKSLTYRTGHLLRRCCLDYNILLRNCKQNNYLVNIFHLFNSCRPPQVLRIYRCQAQTAPGKEKKSPQGRRIKK